MTKTEYREYIASEGWQQRRKLFIEHHYLCNRCGLHRSLAVIAYDQDIHVHHKNYQRLGAELDSDLESLCRRCHEIESFGHSNLHLIAGLILESEFYKSLWYSLGPTMVSALAEAHRGDGPVPTYIEGSVEAIRMIACTLFRFF